MTRILIMALVALSVAYPVLAAYPGDVTGRYPAADFPTGLAWDGRHIWLADRDCGWLYAIDPESGAPVDSVASP